MSLSKDKIEGILLNLEITYTNWLKKLNLINNNKRYSGKPQLSASSAGLCELKHYFKFKEVPSLPTEIKSLSKMRLGTLVHEDIQTSLENFFEEYNVICELPVRYENVKGHVDIVVEISNKECILVDIKTMAAFPWSRKYGRNASPDSALWNKMQLATYALGLMETYNYETVHMYLWNYNKNTSDMKFEPVDASVVDHARSYWSIVTDNLKEYIKYDIDKLDYTKINDAPLYKWECGYCDYKHICRKSNKEVK